MSNTVISIEHLSKGYRLGQIGTGTLTNDLKVWWAKARGRPNPLLRIGEKDHGNRDGQTIWALKDVNFEVKQGEVLGVIGRNGAGKSTLLKILTGVTAPTSGQIKAKGRVASLLEVGTGFHPDLTGRENTYLNGAILGMTKAVIARKFDEIVAFSEVEQFIDTPVKRYSSGMYVRLAFAVAAHLDPEILLVDEVLAVGDAEFQKKCLGKMDSVAQGGRTVLFVSHNMSAIRTLCRRALLLEAGRVALEGQTAHVVQEYMKEGTDTGCERSWPDAAKAPGNEKARLCSVRIRDSHGHVICRAPIDEPLTLDVEYEVMKGGTALNVSVSVFTHDNTYVLATPSVTDEEWFCRPHPLGRYLSRCTIPAELLNNGRYYFTVLLVEDATRIVTEVDRVVSVDVYDTGRRRATYFGYWGGVVRPILSWRTARLPGKSEASETSSDPAVTMGAHR